MLHISKKEDSKIYNNSFRVDINKYQEKLLHTTRITDRKVSIVCRVAMLHISKKDRKNSNSFRVDINKNLLHINKKHR